MDDLLRLVIHHKRTARRWKAAWVWTFGFLLLALLSIEIMIAGKGLQ